MRKEIILIILMSLSIAAWSKTSSQSNRLLQVEITTSSSKVCASFPDRNALIDEKAKIEAAKNRAAMNAAFKISGN